MGHPAPIQINARYEMIDEIVHIRMRDGVTIALRIYRPKAEGPFPCLFAASPYQFDTDSIPHSALFLWREVGPVEWYVREQGYAYIHADVRGSGRSGGEYSLVSYEEQQDLYEIIEWIGRQAWSNGRVGGIGQSYYAWTQWFMGVVNPPSLKCIAPYDGATDFYRDVTYHGGIYCEFMIWWYNMVRANNFIRPANLPLGKAMHRDITWEMIEHQTYDDWWKERSPIERIKNIKVPIFSIGHWGKLGLHLRGNIVGYERAEADKKLLVTGGKDVFEVHEMFDTIDFHKEYLLPFYDQHLKQVASSYSSQAPVQLFVRGLNQYKAFDQWPPRQIQTVSFFLSGQKTGSVDSINDGSLTRQADAVVDAATEFHYPDPRWKFGVVTEGKFGPDPIAGVLTFCTEPLEQDLEVVGPVVLELFFKSTNIDSEFIVKLSDQMPQTEASRQEGRQPGYTVVSKGWMRASHREKDATLSTDFRPVYTHTDPQPIVPGEVYKLEIEILPCAYLFKKGHRVRLEISNCDSPMTDSLFSHQYLWYKVGTDTLMHAKPHASRLILPVMP
jgi:predicted acyl esterase